MKIVEFIGKIINKFDSALWFFRKKYSLSLFKSHGKDIYISKNCLFTEKNITLGDSVYIGSNCIFSSSFGEINIGSHVMFGPGVNIHGGNHRTGKLGCYMDENYHKTQGEDGVINIGNDCWIGANAIILTNVTIGDGCIIGAGAVVTKDIPPYSIYTGVAEPKLRPRFTDDQLKEHINQLNGRN